MTGTERGEFIKAVEARRNGKKLGAAKFGALVDLGIAVVESSSCESLLDLMNGYRRKDDTYCFRRGLFFAMRAALLIKCGRPPMTLPEAVWEVENRIRHAGRVTGKRCVGSTLLVKGLEFDHAVIIHDDAMNRRDWYVALTRAVKGVTILSPAEKIVPAEC
jgi:hypothetical protein